MSGRVKSIVLKLKDPMELFCILRCFLLMPFYQRFILPHKVKKVREKEIIDVLFVIHELGSWKTEGLYLKMKAHPRFNPTLLLVEENNAKYVYDILKNYLDEKKYDYNIISSTKNFRKLYNPDIIFYQKPYLDVIDPKLFFHHNLDVLFCYMVYCFRNRTHPEVRKYYFFNYVWQMYAENEIVIKELSPLLFTKGKNMINTGLSFMDDLLLDKSHYNDPWKSLEGKKKRIIYAPHHTIATFDSGFYKYGTFMDYCDFMLEMAEKYKDETQWAFKPHPLLKMKLIEVWGEKKTEAYYKKWQNLENGQISEGEYMGLFKHSDAMIHDCGSFKLEYLYTGNPVMYLVKEDQEYDYPNWQTQEALRLHYQARSSADIEEFIRNVIKNKDDFKDERDSFVKNYLTPPNGKSACDNIIDAILG